MHRSVAITLFLMLAACSKDPFGLRDTPRTATEVAYAREVCEAAGRQSRACIDARHQMDLQCYRTLGTVDCYRTGNPFGNAESDRAVVAPIDRRTAPQPLEAPEAEEQKSEELDSEDTETEELAKSEPEPDAQAEATPTE
ncbi:MAG: hypothetical protein P1U49_18450 [Minwuia sp.]|nr:hypothetical protein [Minwuia sp.]